MKKEKILFKNLVRVINASIDSTCSSCIERGGVCLDENFDDHMDKCFCQIDNDLCNGRTTSLIPITQPLRKYTEFFCSFHFQLKK